MTAHGSGPGFDECDRGGCGECASCRTALAGTHPDITVVSDRGRAAKLLVAGL